MAEWRSETNSKAFQLRYLDETWHTCPPVLSGESRARLPNELPLGRRSPRSFPVPIFPCAGHLALRDRDIGILALETALYTDVPFLQNAFI